MTRETKVLEFIKKRDANDLPLAPGLARNVDDMDFRGGVTLDALMAVAIPAIIPSGVYFLLCDGEVVYVGQSVNVPVRVCGHMQQGIIQFDSYAWVSVPREELLYTEAAYIVKFRPRYNTSMVKDKNGMPAQSTMPKPNT